MTLAGPGPPASNSGVMSIGDGAGPLTSNVQVANSVFSGFDRDLNRVNNGLLTADWSRFATGDGPSNGANNTSAALDCSSARRAMGAFEFQPGQRAPINLTASAEPGSAATGEPVGF